MNLPSSQYKKPTYKKSVVFLYNSNESLKFEIWKLIPCTMVPKKWKYESNKICAGSALWKLQNVDESNQSRPKQMERYTMFTGWEA